VEKIRDRITRKCIRKIQGCDITLSCDDSGLKNTWEEICVQIQGEYSFYWDTYEETIEQFIQPCIDNLNEFERFALWLQTDEGMGYDENEDAEPAVSDWEILKYIKSEIFRLAGEWSNKRIRGYLEKGGEIDL
jgi:hypothetical protein